MRLGAKRRRWVRQRFFALVRIITWVSSIKSPYDASAASP